MRYSDPETPVSRFHVAEGNEEERLRRENQDLKRRIEELNEAGKGGSHHGPPAKLWHPSGITIWSIVLGAVILLTVAFFAGYIPLRKQRSLIVDEAREQDRTLPRVDVIQVGRSSRKSELELPGSIQAITEAPILARADGYVIKRMVDIGDRVKAAQPLAEIEAPEMDAQVSQAKANLQQAQAAVEQASASYQQGKSDAELARMTADRWRSLAAKGIVSKQENDQYQAQFQSRTASLQALDKAIAAQRGNVAAAEANLARLERMQSYRVVRAPFSGVVTLRNVDVGTLVTAGSTLLFRIAQTGTLRTYVNVPQTNSSSIRAGQPARLSVANLPGRQFVGTVARTASSLDPTSRTLLVEIHVPNTEGALSPGMYAQVDLSSTRANPPLLVPSGALILGTAGTSIALVRPDHTVHVQKIAVGRDYGDRLEVIGGLEEGDTIIANPGDIAREGLKVDPVPVATPAATPTASK